LSEAYARSIADVFWALAERTGSSVIVDTSKDPRDAALVRNVPGLDVRPLHLLRDPRGVLWSRLRRGITKRRFTSRSRVAHIVRESLAWQVHNEAAAALTRRRHGLGTLRFEEFVDDPTAHVEAIAIQLGRAVPTGLKVAGGAVHLGLNHTAGGNQNRWEIGSIELRVDRSGKERFSPAEQWMIEALTWPVRRRIRPRAAVA
jgi:hypothetical protein